MAAVRQVICRCGETVTEVVRPAGTATMQLPVEATPWAPARIVTHHQEFPEAVWFRGPDGRPHRCPKQRRKRGGRAS